MIKVGLEYKGVAIFAKDFSGLPARKISKKLRDRQCLRLPRSVLVTSFRPNKGSKHRFQMTWRRFVKPAFSLRYASWKHMPYGYRGLKIFTSLSLRCWVDHWNFPCSLSQNGTWTSRFIPLPLGKRTCHSWSPMSEQVWILICNLLKKQRCSDFMLMEWLELAPRPPHQCHVNVPTHTV